MGWGLSISELRTLGARGRGAPLVGRAHDITAVTLTEPYQHLFQRMRKADWNDGHERSNDALAAVAGLLVHVETDAGAARLAECMSRCPQGATKPYVSEARFRRLLEAPDIDALFAGLRRTLPLMGAGAPVMTLADDVLSWAWPEKRDDVKKRWAYSYDWPAQTAQ